VRRIAIVVAPALFVEAMLYALLAPLLPHYVDDLGLSTTSAGLLTASFAVGNLAFGLPGGALAARFGGRRTLLAGVGGLACASIAFAFSHHVALLDASRFVQGGSASILWSGGLTWASDAAPGERRGATIGTLLGVGIAGAPFGPLVGGLAVATSPTVVFVAIGVGLLPLMAAILATPETARTSVAAAPLRHVLRAPHRATTVRALTLALMPSIGFGILFVLGPLRLSAAGTTAGAIAVTFALASACEAAATPWSGRLTDRRGPRPVLRVALPAAGAALVLFSLPFSALPLAVATIVSLACLGLVWVPSTVGLQGVVGAVGASEGHGFALFNTCWAGGQAIGAIGGGALAEASGYGAPSLAIGLLLIATGALAARRPNAPGAVPPVLPNPPDRARP
jgi:predicted MFS family arabinose efflux permease